MHWGSMVGSAAWGDRWSSGAFDTGAASRKRPGGSAGGCGYGGCGVGTTYVLRTVPNSCAEVLGDSPPVIQVHLPPHSPIASSGFTAAAPAISFDKAYTIFSIASSLLNELVDDGSVDVAMDHDPEWQRFPEVGEAIKASGADPNCFALASCPGQMKWGIGIASGWRNREAAAKLALVVAMTTGETEKKERLARKYPEYRALCARLGADPLADPANKRPRLAAIDDVISAALQFSAAASMHQLGGGPAPPVHWFVLKPDSQLVLSGMPPDGPGVCHDKTFADHFRNSHHILQELVGDVRNTVAFHHDPDWTLFPDIGEMIGKAVGEDNCFCVVTCASLGRWALGIGNGWKTRESAGKLALAACIAVGLGMAALGPLSNQYPEFPPVVENARRALADGTATTASSSSQHAKA